jgi:hypothetical protein
MVALALMAAALLSAQSAPQVRIVESDPSSRGTLDGRQALYLRITYTSDIPLRFRAKAYNQGALVERGAAYNPAPAYPAGQGEALAWLSFDDEARIDEVRVTALDEKWREIVTHRFAVDVRWNGVAPRRQREPAAWASRLSDAQQRMSSSATKDGDGGGGVLGGLLFSLMGLSIPLYLILQAFMLVRLRGGWRKAAMVPLVGMIPLVLFTLFGLLAGANLWPLMLLFLTPVAVCYLVVLWFMKSLMGRPTQYAPNP